MATALDILTLNGYFGDYFLSEIFSSTLKEFPLIEGTSALPSVPVPLTTFQHAFVSQTQADALADVNDGTGIVRNQPTVANITTTCKHYDAGWHLTNHDLYGYSFGKEKLIQMRVREATRAAFNRLSVDIVAQLDAFTSGTAAATIGSPAVAAGTAAVGTTDTTTIPFYFVSRNIDGIGIAWGKEGQIIFGPQIQQELPSIASAAGKSNFGIAQAIDGYASLFVGQAYAAGKLVMTVGAIPGQKANLIDDALRNYMANFPLGYMGEIAAIYTSRRGKAAVAQYRLAYNPAGIPADYNTSIDGIPIIAVDQIQNTANASFAAPEQKKSKSNE